MSIKNGFEYLYKSMVKYAEDNCIPLFSESNGEIDFLVIANDNLEYRKKILEELGYEKQIEEDYDNYVYPNKVNVTLLDYRYNSLQY